MNLACLKNLILIAACLLITVGARAELMPNPLSQGRGASPFEVLKNLYDQATSPAALEDFDLSLKGKTSPQKCIASRKSSFADKNWVDPHPYFAWRVWTILKKGTPGTDAIPSQGPLFPGTPAVPAIPDEWGFAIAAGRTNGLHGSCYACGFPPYLEQAEVSTTPTDLVSTLHLLEQPYVAHVFARKNGQYLALHVFSTVNPEPTSQSADDNFDVYAYCYGQPAKHKGVVDMYIEPELYF